ncbi:MAG: hypothetical protein NTU69_08930 [Proteobacteria bacterium]|nr:hypothetical protein [Pseudomonadota bacterium]
MPTGGVFFVYLVSLVYFVYIVKHRINNSLKRNEAKVMVRGFQAEAIFDGLREAQGLRRAGVHRRTSKRRDPQRDKTRCKKRFGPIVERLKNPKENLSPWGFLILNPGNDLLSHII